MDSVSSLADTQKGDKLYSIEDPMQYPSGIHTVNTKYELIYINKKTYYQQSLYKQENNHHIYKEPEHSMETTLCVLFTVLW